MEGGISPPLTQLFKLYMSQNFKSSLKVIKFLFQEYTAL
jgi:hypothetical protein